MAQQLPRSGASRAGAGKKTRALPGEIAPRDARANGPKLEISPPFNRPGNAASTRYRAGEIASAPGRNNWIPVAREMGARFSGTLDERPVRRIGRGEKRDRREASPDEPPR